MRFGVTIAAMQRIAWIIAVLVVIPSVAKAGDWEKLMTDLELLDELIQHDDADMEQQRFDAEIENNTELFPGEEGEDEEKKQELSLSDTHVTIKVDGVPVVLDDVPSEEWFAQYVRDAAERGFVSGYKDNLGRPSGQYGPADAVTVEQIAKMAVIAAGADPYVCGEQVKNVSAAGSWSERYVGCAELKKWAVYSDGSIDVSKPATRAEVVVTVLQAYGARVSPVSGSIFTDVTRATVFGNAVETAATMGIVSGYSDDLGNPTGYFGPSDAVNRAEAAKIFSLAAKRFGEY